MSTDNTKIIWKVHIKDMTIRHHYLTSWHNIWQVNIIVWKHGFLVTMSTCQKIMLTSRLQLWALTCYINKILSYKLSWFFFWQVDINNWYVNIKIWQIDVMIWQVMTEICHHSLSMKYKISTCTIVALTYGNIDCIKKELRRQSEMETSAG